MRKHPTRASRSGCRQPFPHLCRALSRWGIAWLAWAVEAPSGESLRSPAARLDLVFRCRNAYCCAICQDLPSVVIAGAITISACCISLMVDAPQNPIAVRIAPTRF